MLTLFLCLLGLFQGARAGQAIPVVASFTVLRDLVCELGRERVEVSVLVGPDSDAHVYEPTPADVKAVAAARIIVLNGLGFEGWISRLLDSAQSRGVVVVASRGVSVRDAQGHPDPHAWQDPRNVQLYVTNITAALVAADPQHAVAFHENEKTYLRKLEDLDRSLRREFSQIPTERRRVITTHDAFGYFGAAYGIQFLPAQGWTTESEPSPANIARLVSQARQQKVTAVFLENISDPRLMLQLARDTGLRIGGRLHSDALGPPGDPSATYLGLITTNAQLLLDAMRAEPRNGSKEQ